MAEDIEQGPTFDAERLAAEIRKGDAAALEQAARQVFDTGLGRHVLAAFLIDNGVGRPLGRPGMTAEELFYQVGRHDAALSLVETVFDQPSLIVSLFTRPPQEEHNDEPEFELQGEFTGGFGHVGNFDDEDG